MSEDGEDCTSYTPYGPRQMSDVLDIRPLSQHRPDGRPYADDKCRGVLHPSVDDACLESVASDDSSHQLSLVALWGADVQGPGDNSSRLSVVSVVGVQYGRQVGGRKLGGCGRCGLLSRARRSDGRSSGRRVPPRFDPGPHRANTQLVARPCCGVAADVQGLDHVSKHDPSATTVKLVENLVGEPSHETWTLCETGSSEKWFPEVEHCADELDRSALLRGTIILKVESPGKRACYEDHICSAQALGAFITCQVVSCAEIVVRCPESFFFVALPQIKVPMLCNASKVFDDE